MHRITRQSLKEKRHQWLSQVNRQNQWVNLTKTCKWRWSWAKKNWIVKDLKKNPKNKLNSWINRQMLEYHAGLNNTKQASNRVMILTLVLTMVLISLPLPITMQIRISNKMMEEIIMKWISLACKTITKSNLNLWIIM